MIGKTLAHYEIVDKIGAGGMGEVYRARDPQLDREVAIKILPESFRAEPERLARFEREARLLASLNHPGIATVHGLHEDGGVHFLAMELVPGLNLAERLQQGAVSLEQALDIARQVAEALEVAHEQGVIHRDLKPANIVITPDGKAKVLDFGLAKSMESAPGEQDLSQSPTLAAVGTMQGMILGTAAYMSPEQARGQPLDKRSDIWSYGVILYEMVMGRQLFTGDTVSDTMAGVLKTQISFEDLPVETSRALRSLLQRCLDRDVAQRLRDIGEARILLSRVQAGEQDEPQAAAGETVRPGALRSVGGWVVAALAVVVVVAVFLLRSEPASGPGLPLRKLTIPRVREDPSLQKGHTISPDGRYLAYTSDGQLWLRDLTAIEPRPLPGTEGATNPFWSPDGRWIAYGAGQAVLKIARDGGTPVPVSRLSNSQALSSTGSAGAWLEDGRLVLGTGLSGLMAVSAQGGEATEILPTSAGETDFHEVAPLPGGGVVFVIHDGNGTSSMDALGTDGQRKPVLRLKDGVEDPVFARSGHVLFHRRGETAGIWALPFSARRLEATGEPFLVAAGGRHPSVSADGTLVYLQGARTRLAQMVTVDRSGAVLRELGPVEQVSRPFPELSPDDRFVLHAVNFGDGREMFRYDIEAGNRQRLTFNELPEDMGVLHPNGTDMIYYENNTYGSWVHSITGEAEPYELLRGIMVSFTLDGTQIVFARNQSESFNFDILMRDFDGGADTEKVLVATDGLDWAPRLSPDGRYLAYASNETGRYQVYVTTFPGVHTRWQISKDGGEWPRWRGDGREIFFTTRERMMAVDVSTEEGFRVGTPRELFRRPSINWNSTWSDSFDVSSDGETFILFRPVLEKDAAPPALVVVQNWLREFDSAP